MTDTPPEQPERTRFVDPPPAEPAPELPDEPTTGPAVPAPPASPPVPVEPSAAEPAAEPATEPATEPRTAEPPAAVAAAVEPPAVAPAATVPPAVEPPAPAAVEPAAAPGPWLIRSLAVLALLLAVVVGLLAWWAWPLTHAGKPAFDTQGSAALRAAKADAKLVLAYDYRDLDSGFRKAVAVTTDVDGKDCPKKVDPQDKAYDAKADCFRSEFTRTHEKVVIDFAKRYQTVVLADVSAGGVERVQGDEATVLLYVNQQSTNNLSASPKITQDRVEMTMKKVGGRWLVAGITAL